MLEHFYKERRTLLDFRRGPLGPYFDGFAEELESKRYSRPHGNNILANACQFNNFLINHGIKNAKAISWALVESFLKGMRELHGAARAWDHIRCLRTQTKHLVRYLVGLGVMKPFIPKPDPKPYSWVLDPYLKLLREDRSEGRILDIRRQLCPFLDGLEDKATPKALKTLRPEDIESYVNRHLKESPENMRRLTGALRGFLRFCARQRYTAQDLSGIISSVPAYRLSSLPKGYEDGVIERLLKGVDQNTAAGSRDYAILLLLTAYGVRGIQIADLRLEDICWPRSTIRIRARKGGKEVLSPLSDPVGEAILRYLRHRPPDSPFRQVFLSVRAPFGPLTSTAITMIVRQSARRAGVAITGKGTRAFRHSWAIRTLTQGSSIKAIADMLGHRHIDTTFIYAKADLPSLRSVAMPWPEIIR